MNTSASTVTWLRAKPALKPPAGFRLARAMGLTYSLDLTTLSESLAAMAGPETPLALADRVTVVCQASRLRTGAAPREEHRLLDKCVRTIAPPEGAFFHPKVWLLKFDGGGPARWRLIAGSLNISETPDAGEASVVLAGENAPGIRGLNGELISFLRSACPGEEALWRELSEVRFAPPPGFAGWRFAGQRGLPHAETLFAPLADGGFALRAIVSPALSDEALERFLAGAPGTPMLVSTRAGLDSVSPAVLARFDAHLVPDSAGLHAKAMLGERRGRTELWLGSANATKGSWFGTNAECMIALECGGYSLERLKAELPELAPYRRALDEAGEEARRARKKRGGEVERYLGFLNRAAWTASFEGSRAELRFETGETNPMPGLTATVGLLGHPVRRSLGDLTGTGRLGIEGVDERSRTDFLEVGLALENPARVSRFLMQARSGFDRKAREAAYFLR